MANNYYDATGVLVLDRVTPVISALFGDFKLDADHPGNGQAYIARIAEENDPQWEDVLFNLMALAADLGLPAPNGDDSDQEPSLSVILDWLAGHFGATGDADLLNFIEHHQADDPVELAALFLIATCFNDGHNLQEIRMEGCWHCSKPRLFEFGGDGEFLSREWVGHGASSHTIGLGRQLRSALVQDDLDTAAQCLDKEMRRLLAGITDDRQRSQVQQRLAVLLLANSA